MHSDVFSIKALTFDVFGTVVDTYTSIVNELTQFGKAKHLDRDWPSFAVEWISGYGRYVSSGGPWMSVDEINRNNLNRLLYTFSIGGLSESEKVHLNEIWHRLKAWPDSAGGLQKLRRSGFTVATLSNGGIRLLTEMAKNAGLTWDHVLSAESVESYKPDPRVYRMAAEKLALPPEQIMMVASHVYDLRDGAKPLGFKTAFVTRPGDFGPGNTPELPTDDDGCDLIVRDFNELADRLRLPA